MKNLYGLIIRTNTIIIRKGHEQSKPWRLGLPAFFLVGTKWVQFCDLETKWRRFVSTLKSRNNKKSAFLSAFSLLPAISCLFQNYCVALPDELSRHVFGLILSHFLKYHRYLLATDWQHRAFLSPYFHCLSADERMC